MTRTQIMENGGENPKPIKNVEESEEVVVLGIDGGTTSTICVCIPFPLLHSHSHSHSNSNHKQEEEEKEVDIIVLGRSVSGCSNHNSVGETLARDTLDHVMMEALLKSGKKKSAVKAVCLGLSGVNHPKDQQRILYWLRDIFPNHVKLYVQNDAVAALASGSMGKLHGCVLIAGTGSIAYGFSQDGKEARAAGGGPVLGDWGSGYGIAARALTAVVRAHDGRGPQTMLTDSILKTLALSSPDELIGGYGIAARALTAVVRAHDGRGPQTMLTDSILKTLALSSPDELIGWTYADPSWARIAALVPVVVSCAEAGDEVANEILNDAVAELALTVKAVVQRLGLCGQDGSAQFPIVLVGGVLVANQNWDIGQKVVDCLMKTYPGAFPVWPKVEPAVGAALLACNFLMKEKERNSLV